MIGMLRSWQRNFFVAPSSTPSRGSAVCAAHITGLQSNNKCSFISIHWRLGIYCSLLAGSPTLPSGVTGKKNLLPVTKQHIKKFFFQHKIKGYDYHCEKMSQSDNGIFQIFGGKKSKYAPPVCASMLRNNETVCMAVNRCCNRLYSAVNPSLLRHAVPKFTRIKFWHFLTFISTLEFFRGCTRQRSLDEWSGNPQCCL